MSTSSTSTFLKLWKTWPGETGGGREGGSPVPFGYFGSGEMEKERQRRRVERDTEGQRRDHNNTHAGQEKSVSI